MSNEIRAELDARWKTLTSVDTDPDDRRRAALDMLVWHAKGGQFSLDGVITWRVIETCEAVIIAEFERRNP